VVTVREVRVSVRVVNVLVVEVVLEVVLVVEIEQNSQLVSHFPPHSQVGQKIVSQRSEPGDNGPSWQTTSSSGKW